jgi:hypothetical protein
MSVPNSALLCALTGNPDITDDFCKLNCRMREYLEQGDEIDTYYKRCGLSVSRTRMKV